MFRILIVEDEPDIGELLQTYLEHAWYVTRLAQEGLDAPQDGRIYGLPSHPGTV